MSKIGGEVKITFILYLFPGMSGFHIVMQDTDSTNRQTPKTIQYIVLPPGKNINLEIMIACKYNELYVWLNVWF